MIVRVADVVPPSVSDAGARARSHAASIGVPNAIAARLRPAAFSARTWKV